MRKNRVQIIFIYFIIFRVGICSTNAEDWPAQMHDNAGSGVSAENISPRKLRETWQYTSPAPPQTAWDTGAPWDAFSAKMLFPRRTFDYAFHTVIVSDRVIFGSSVTNSVHCLSLKTGKSVWTFTTDGPVRVAPTLYDNKLYFGSDDGYVYCVNSKNGKLIWKFAPDCTKNGALICGNGKLISKWPVRTGVVAVGGNVFFAASLLPWRASYICSLNAETGKANYIMKARKGMTAAGKIVTNGDLLFFPEGNSATEVYRIDNGAFCMRLPIMGTQAMLICPSYFAQSGSFWQNKTGMEQLSIINFANKKKLAKYSGGRCVCVVDKHIYVALRNQIVAYDNGKIVWKTSSNLPYSMIIAGETIFLGNANKVTAYNRSNGKQITTLEVQGKVYALSAGYKHLLVSTDTGSIYAFCEKNKACKKPGL